MFKVFHIVSVRVRKSKMCAYHGTLRKSPLFPQVFRSEMDNFVATGDSPRGSFSVFGPWRRCWGWLVTVKDAGNAGGLMPVVPGTPGEFP